MLISPLHFKEFETNDAQAKEPRKKPFASKKQQEEIVEAPPPPPTFSEEQLKNAERDAYQKGFLDGVQDGIRQAQSEQAEIEKTIIEGLKNFTESLTPIFESYRNHAGKIKSDMPTLALAIAKKVAKDALSEPLTTIIEEAALRCAELSIGEPHISVAVNSRLFENLSAKIKQIGGREKSAAHIKIISDDNIPVNDYRIEWKSGQMEHNTEKLWAAVDKAIDNMLQAIKNEPEEQQDLFMI